VVGFQVLLIKILGNPGIGIIGELVKKTILISIFFHLKFLLNTGIIIGNQGTRQTIWIGN